MSRHTPTEPISLARPTPPTRSWWAEPGAQDRAEFARRLDERRPHMKVPSTRTSWDNGHDADLSIRRAQRRAQAAQVGRFLRAASGVWLLALILAAPAAAQTLGPLVDKDAMGIAGTEWWPAELDGEASTAEWLGMRFDPDAIGQIVYQVGVLRQGRFCVGPRIDPVALALTWVREFSAAIPMDVRGVWMLVVQGDRYYREVTFDLPACGGS